MSGKRLRVYLEPRDAWVGIYFGPEVTYVCPLPFLVIRWVRKPGLAAPYRREGRGSLRGRFAAADDWDSAGTNEGIARDFGERP